MFKTLKIGADAAQIADLLEILERHLGALRKDLRKYAETGEKPKTTRTRSMLSTQGMDDLELGEAEPS